MLRLSEIGLFLLPFGLYALWLFLARRGNARAMWVVLGVAVAALLLFGGAATWLMQAERFGPSMAYVPERWENGHMVPAHAVPRDATGQP